jgi:hypothetical protein
LPIAGIFLMLGNGYGLKVEYIGTAIQQLLNGEA